FAVQDRQLRDVAGAHALKGGEQGIVRPDRNHFALFGPMRDKIAQIALGWPLDEALLRHPEIVEHLREILVAGVANEGDNALLFRLLPAIAESASEQRAGR